MMNYAGTGIISIKAVQELYKENQVLKAQNEDMILRMTKLENQMQTLMLNVVNQK